MKGPYLPSELKRPLYERTIFFVAGAMVAATLVVGTAFVRHADRNERELAEYQRMHTSTPIIEGKRYICTPETMQPDSRIVCDLYRP